MRLRIQARMNCIGRLVALPLFTTVFAAHSQQVAVPARIELRQAWHIQSSAKVTAGGGAISTAGYGPEGWYAAQVPTTVLAALVAHKVYPDPYFGMNLRSIPGSDSYAIAANFARIDMRDDSPFKVAWWYRTEFRLPAASRGSHVALHFDGINYRATVWLNGRRIATPADIAGAYRLYEFDVTALVKPG